MFWWNHFPLISNQCCPIDSVCFSNSRKTMWMTLLLISQQSCFWIYIICGPLSSMHNDFNYLRHLGVENDEMPVYFHVSSKQFSIWTVRLMGLWISVLWPGSYLVLLEKRACSFGMDPLGSDAYLWWSWPWYPLIRAIKTHTNTIQRT